MEAPAAHQPKKADTGLCGRDCAPPSKVNRTLLRSMVIRVSLGSAEETTGAAKALRIATVNVNGIRAAYKRGMADWLAERDIDILCLQEVRAPDAIVRELLGDEWFILHAEA